MTGRAVTNELRATVVYCSPTVCVAYPAQSSTPSSVDASQSRRPPRRNGRNTTVATANRPSSSCPAGNVGSAPLVTTNVVPHRNVVSSRISTPRAALGVPGNGGTASVIRPTVRESVKTWSVKRDD